MKIIKSIIMLALVATSLVVAGCTPDPIEDTPHQVPGTDPGTDPGTGTWTGDGTIFVDTTPICRNILIEEITGIKCVYCPDGHNEADRIAAAYNGRAFVINIHASGLAEGEPNYKTDDGDSLYNTFGSAGLPCAYINRYPWGSSGTYPKGRGEYSSCSYKISHKPAYINIAASSTIDTASRKLTVHVQAYFTDTTSATSLLNVALIQNNILGPQSGAARFYPEHYDSITGMYTHNHMFRKFLTGTWGEEIPYTGKGSLFERTITYTIPEQLGRGNIDVVLEDLEIIVFVTQPSFYNDADCSVNVINVNRSELRLI